MDPREDRVGSIEPTKTVISGEFDNMRRELAILQESVSHLCHTLHPICGPSRNANKEDTRAAEPEQEKSEFARGLNELAGQVQMIRRDVQDVINRIEI